MKLAQLKETISYEATEKFETAPVIERIAKNVMSSLAKLTLIPAMHMCHEFFQVSWSLAVMKPDG